MRAALDVFGKNPFQAILVAPKGSHMGKLDPRVQTFKAGHPIPDRSGLEAAETITNAAHKMQGNELLVCMISGGASAMLPSPPQGVRLQDEVKLTRLLLSKRVMIHEINTIRRHLSTLKGGRLATLCPASTILSLIISDVPGNFLPDIASGMTVEDPTTYSDAVETLKRNALWGRIPERVRNHFIRGLRGEVPESPKPGTPQFRKVHNMIIGDNMTACQRAKVFLKKKGVETRILTSSAEMEARQMGKLLASLAVGSKEYEKPFTKSMAMIIGGETTVELKGSGKGGRNQETVLSATREIVGLNGVVVAALGTDGVDGNSPAAGAIADGRTALRAGKKRFDPAKFLARNDSYRFFNGLNDAILTAPTGTNVGDIYVMMSQA